MCILCVVCIVRACRVYFIDQENLRLVALSHSCSEPPQSTGSSSFCVSEAGNDSGGDVLV